MSTYGYSEPQIESMVAKARRYRLCYCVAASVAIAATVALLLVRPHWVLVARIWVFAVVVPLFVHPLIQQLWGWKRRLPDLEASLRQMEFEVSPERISYAVSAPLSLIGGGAVAGAAVRQIDRNAIVCAEELSSGRRPGIFLRTANRYQWLRIPRAIDGYEQLKGELVSMGIRVVRASVGPNWEEFVFVFLFLVTLLCPLVVHAMRVRIVSLAVSLLLIVPGIMITRVAYANANILHNRTTAYLGLFIPAAGNLALLFLRK